MKLASVEPGKSAIIKMPADRASAGRFMIDLPPQVIAARTDARNRIGPYLRLNIAIGDMSDSAGRGRVTVGCTVGFVNQRTDTARLADRVGRWVGSLPCGGDRWIRNGSWQDAGVLDGLLLKEHELAESSAALQRRIEDYRVRLEVARARESAAGGANPPADPSARKYPRAPSTVRPV
jgi:hypothetical protein